MLKIAVQKPENLTHYFGNIKTYTCWMDGWMDFVCVTNFAGFKRTPLGSLLQGAQNVANLGKKHAAAAIFVRWLQSF